MNSRGLKRWFLQAAILLSAFLFFSPHQLRAQQQQAATCNDWTAVQSWSGTMTVSGSGQSTDQNGNVYTTSESAIIGFKTTNSPIACDPSPLLNHEAFSWQGNGSQVSYSVAVHDKVVSPCLGSDGNTYTQTTSYDVDNGTNSQSNAGLSMEFSNATSGGYGIYWGEYVDGLKITISGPCGSNSYISSGPEPWGMAQIPSAGLTSIDFFPNPLPLPSTVSTLSCSPNPTFQASAALGGVATWTIGCNMVPAFDYDVVITTLPDYATWRPTGGRSETDLGNALIVQAEIVSKSTGQIVQVTPDQWTFALNDISSEPGVALNWPSLANVASASAADLDFKDFGNSVLYPNISISSDGSNAQIVPDATNQGNLDFVELFVDSHDWGGWATLNVTATVAGTTISGHLKGDPNTNILLPKRQSGSHIADIWKTQHDVALSTPDSDDSETSPQGDGQPGDGFTLYEEYRGFYLGCSNNSNPPQPEGTPGASCQHVEGDPTTKDVFIVDKIGAPAGIKLFQAGSDLNVHFSGLKLADVGPQGNSYRVINFNHGQGAHEVDQHAIVLDYGVSKGFSEVVTTSDYTCPDGTHSCPALPKHIDHVALNANFKTQPGAVNKVPAYRSDVAHEIAHAVDVYHHGDADAGVVWWQPDPNTGGVIEESLDQNHSPVPSTARTVYVMEEDQDPSSLGNALSAKYLHVPSGGMDVYVGNTVCSGVVVQHGPHSGDEASFMRYHYASAYIPLGSPSVRFLVDEVPGVDLTDHPIGTGVNDPNRVVNGMPRVRYGDADVTDRRGNDASQIDVSDNHNEVIRPSQTCP
jgi:hypothetical protein